MRLPQETERYVFRILAVKAVLSNPNQYGYDLPKGWGYQELRLDRVNVSLSRPVPIQTIAAAAGTTYREIKRLNPVFRSDDIPAGNHEIKLPMGAGKVFEQNFRSGNAAPGGAASTESPSAQRQDAPVPAAPAVTAAPAAKAESAGPQHKTRGKVYVVRKGDSLSAIARHYDISTKELKAANKLRSDDLTPGQKLRIP
jgi:LysM repeat protein